MSHKTPTPRTSNRPQAGFALIVGLLLLIVMSVIGATMMSVTSLETQMAGGSRESNVAFQAAEAALRDAEAHVETTASIADDFPDNEAAEQATDGAVGHVGENAAEPDYSSTDIWKNTGIVYSRAYGATAYPEVLFQPRFIVKHVGDVIDEATAKADSLSVGGGGKDISTTPSVSIFRVTARGTSRDGAAAAVLQSYYGRAY